MVDGRQEIRDVGVVASALDRHATLPDRGDEHLRVELLRDELGHVEHLERRDRHDDRTAVRDLGQPRLDVAAQLDEIEIGSHRTELARRRTAPVATVAPCGSCSRLRPTSASAGLRRAQNAPIVSPGSSIDGRSFAECAAMSARPSRSARCTSFTNTP
jgi:hypothetical protein